MDDNGGPLGALLVAVGVFMVVAVAVEWIAAFIVVHWVTIVALLALGLAVVIAIALVYYYVQEWRKVVAYKHAVTRAIQAGEQAHKEIETAYWQAQAEMHRIANNWNRW